MTSAPYRHSDPSPTGWTVTVSVRGGFDDAFRVLSLLRTRAYRVSALDLATTTTDGSTIVRFRVDLAPSRVDLLVDRLHRLPVVLATQLGP